MASLASYINLQACSSPDAGCNSHLQDYSCAVPSDLRLEGTVETNAVTESGGQGLGRGNVRAL